MTLPAKTQALLEELRMQDRRCNGGPSGPWCGKRATVICTDASKLQWYACETSEHHGGAETMAIDEWWQLVASSIAAR